MGETNLTQCLSPCNQMESLLVEKIAVDFWRLRRTIRFEAGSISKHIEDMVKERYSYSRSDNRTIDTQIEFAKERIVWNTAYLKCLKKNEVSFDQPIWEGKNISSDVIEDFRLIARNLPNLTRAELEQIHEEESTLENLAVILSRHGYSQDEHIATRLIELYSDENKKLEQEVEELQQKKANNQEEDFCIAMIGAAPSEETTEKALKYERSIQKSIFQNLFLLKKLQEMF